MFCCEQQGGMQVFSEGSTRCGCMSENIAPPIQGVVARPVQEAPASSQAQRQSSRRIVERHRSSHRRRAARQPRPCAPEPRTAPVHDTKLDRDVAIKVQRRLPLAPSVWPPFDRDAETLAAPNHPGIAQIYGLEESDGIRSLHLCDVPPPSSSTKANPPRRVRGGRSTPIASRGRGPPSPRTGSSCSRCRRRTPARDGLNLADISLRAGARPSRA